MMFQDGLVMALGTMAREGSVGRPASQGEGRLEAREARGEQGARSKTPPGTPSKARGKLVGVRVLMLDDSITLFQVQVRHRIHWILPEHVTHGPLKTFFKT